MEILKTLASLTSVFSVGLLSSERMRLTFALAVASENPIWRPISSWVMPDWPTAYLMLCMILSCS